MKSRATVGPSTNMKNYEERDGGENKEREALSNRYGGDGASRAAETFSRPRGKL